MADVFISYARIEADQVAFLKSRLESLGLEVFFDVDGGIEAGDSFPERIANAVLGAKAVLACWTPHALTRPWVRRECMMAREFGKLVPVAMRRLTAMDLKEFIDASYEDLTDFTGQDTHFGWGQTLAAIARKMDAWVEEHPNDVASTEVIDRANSVRKAAHEARKGLTPSGAAAVQPLSDVQKLWVQLQESLDPERLLRFAESFPNTSEAYHARERAAQLREEISAEQALDKSSLKAVSAFVSQWPNHHHIRELSSLIPTLSAQENAQHELAKIRTQQSELQGLSAEDQSFQSRAIWGIFVGFAVVAGIVFWLMLSAQS